MSDHYPIKIQLNCVYEIKNCQKADTVIISNKINWNKVDKDGYQDLVAKKLGLAEKICVVETCNLEPSIEKLTSVLKKSAGKSVKRKKKWSSKPNLKVWTAEISLNLQALREANG